MTDSMLFLRIVPHAAFRFLGPSLGALFLARAWGPGFALAAMSALGLVMALLGGLLLQHVHTNGITWRNRLAGWLLPWGYVAGAGSVTRLAVGSWAVWTALAAMGALATSPWLALGWFFDGAVAVWLVRARRQHGYGRVQRRVTNRLLGIVLGCAAGGLLASALGYPIVGAIVAGAPIVVVGGGYALWIGFMTVIRPTRWN